MAAGTKRAKRVKKREADLKSTGIMRKAKKGKFDTQGECDSVARDIGNRKKFHPQDVKSFRPLNPRQEDFIHAYYQDIEMILATGVPGSAKSFLSLACSLTDVFDGATSYKKVIIVRSPVATRDIGALPGTEEEKAAPFEQPYQGLVTELMPKFKGAYGHLKSLGYLEFHLTSHLRGLTWEDSIVIFDEFQSATFHEVNTVITRLGKGSRIILAGDVNQNDLTRRNDQTGFHKILESIGRMPSKSYEHIHYLPEDCVRSGLVREWLLATYE